MAEGVSGTALRVVLLGPPGCGKGTQAALLAETLRTVAIATGDMLREEVAAGSELGKTVQGVMVSGALVDDTLMSQVVRARLEKADADHGFLLDGYPRTTAQAGVLEQILEERNTALDRVVLIDVPEEELVRRVLGRKREDDREDVVRERLRVYHEKTAPLVDYYRQQEILREIDGDCDVEDVTPQILAALR